VYVGQTIKTIQTRWIQHVSQTRYVGSGCNRKICRYLHQAMVKYGIDQFVIEVIDGANSRSELNYREQHWIYRLNSLAPNGYNLRQGGGSREVSQATKDLLSLKLSGAGNPMYGTKRSDKAKHLHR